MQRLEQKQVNANELADRLEQGHWEGGTREQAATMLRQQQEKLTKYELRHVAQRDRIAILEMQHKQQQAEIESLKAKTLTDEEIYEVWKKAMQEEAKIEYSIYATQLERQPFVFFARAILRKAQDK